MEFLLDTIDIPTITKYNQILPLAGVTSNPTIVKKAGKVDFFQQMRQIRQILDKGATLHAQVVSQDVPGMLADAHAILDNIDDQVYIKVPTTENGLAVMKQLKAEGHHVTATAIYTKFQGLLAIGAGADYIAPYYNRMANMNIDAAEVVHCFAQTIAQTHSTTKILAASFHNVGQVTAAIENGAQAVTMGADIVAAGLGMPAIASAVQDFGADWESLYGPGATVTSLAETINSL
ncbi:fructose-6-phosphate aldolase [Agrilactobacillus composti DSM 18527 = JCM 14202]|uniref:Fructose-6-phosphate aldolase n=1 Tax=Agrilactobacillus composti DSM 18527 = JCM 14202 TaxID=1423734 RepID=X0QN18_9LACO|nr:fructose-6-phosphate aldolase [Agrilactobacillus composti]KRM36245.1 fructose-6-phosphate aldolase [Agrilactobacillus composti DSM 18527 = JCM 14202]GAF39985.1 transaldolase [Agrilactobacillus composti DSM 18527 = JCM 14202]